MDSHNQVRQPSTHNQNGFTLIEVLITMVLLSVALLGMAALVAGIMRGNTYSKRLTTATTLAQDKLEEVQRLGYSGNPSENDTDTEDYDTITGFFRYKRVTVTQVNTPDTDMKTITVTVNWDSDDKSVVLKTILSE